jgi:hypothetical protein
MNDPQEATQAPRRGLFGRLAGAVALAAAGLASRPSVVEAAPTDDGLPHWPGKLPGRHKQVVDAVEVNGGFGLIFAWSFLKPNPPGSASAVVVLRHYAAVIGLEHAIWAKYKIGETLKIIDPETKAVATKNPFLRPKSGVLPVDDASIDRMLAQKVTIGICDMALTNLSARMAQNGGVDAATAHKEWVAGAVAGASVLPSGTWAVNRAQEAGCTYCAGA